VEAGKKNSIMTNTNCNPRQLLVRWVTQERWDTRGT